jgi:midasin (ATPase involved in ribosome maturation)
VDQEQIALEGFLVLAERSRNLQDKHYIKVTIEKVFGVTLDIDKFYE